jgi:hypothetical protein
MSKSDQGEGVTYGRIGVWAYRRETRMARGVIIVLVVVLVLDSSG